MKELKEKKGTAVVPVEAAILKSKSAKVAKFKLRGSALLQSAQAIVITDDVSKAKVAEYRVQAKLLQKDVDAEFDDGLKTAHKIWQLVKDGISGMKGDAERTVKECDKKMSDWDLEQDRLAEIARKKAEIEKNRLDKIEADKLLKKAEKAEEKGNEEQASIFREQATTVNNFVPPSQVGPEKQTKTVSGGTSGSKDFSLVITDKMEVIRAIAAGNIPPGVVGEGKIEVQPGQTVIVELKITAGSLKRHAEMLKVGDVLPKIPGCFLKEKMAYRGFGIGGGR